MSIIPLPDKIDDYLERTKIVREIGLSGYVFAINYTISGPEYFDTTFLPEWQQIYQDRGYFLKDPIFLWTLTHTGFKRWSEISFSSKSRVLQEATKFGLNYGVIFARRNGFSFSWFTVSRPDREITDDEIDYLDTLFDEFLDNIQRKEPLSNEEKRVLNAFANGASQREIAKANHMSEGKVKNLVRASKKKLGCKTLAQVVSTAVSMKLI
ncbi:autoinducer binding domain-containing protein [Profundibacter sp.]